jgi:hypothetical protein
MHAYDITFVCVPKFYNIVYSYKFCRSRPSYPDPALTDFSEIFRSTVAEDPAPAPAPALFNVQQKIFEFNIIFAF